MLLDVAVAVATRWGLPRRHGRSTLSARVDRASHLRVDDLPAGGQIGRRRRHDVAGKSGPLTPMPRDAVWARRRPLGGQCGSRDGG